jgi:dTDP-4-dehydrorhamnose reductase
LGWELQRSLAPLGDPQLRLITQKLQNAFAPSLPDWQAGVARMLTEVLEK